MPTAPTLTDGVVTIRMPRADDAARGYEQATDPLSITWTNVPVPYSPEMALDFSTAHAQAAWADGSEWMFAVEVEGRYAGTIALRDEGSGRAEIAYGSHPDVRGTGTMQRALRLLIDWGVAEQGVQAVVWRANVGNWASRKLAWRLGFSVDGVLRGSHPFRGGLVDGWTGALLAGEPMEPRHPWLEAPVLEADGVRLRAFTAADVPRIVEGCRDPDTQRWLSRLPVDYRAADARAFLETVCEAQAAGVGTTWAVVDPADDVLLGSVGLAHVEPGVQAEVGYWTHPDARGRGLTTAAVRLAVAHAVDTLGVRRVHAFAAVGNTVSRRLLERVGMTAGGIERQALTTGAGRVDAARYDVLATEWAAGRGR